MTNIVTESKMLRMLRKDLTKAIKILGESHQITLGDLRRALTEYAIEVHREEIKNRLNNAEHGKTWSWSPLDKSKGEDE